MTAPPPPPPPGDQATPAPPRAGRRRTWIIVLVAVMVTIFAIAGVGTALFISNTLPAFSASDDFMDDLVDGRFEAAADRLCRLASARPEAAIVSITQHFIGGEHLSMNPFTVDRDGDRATVEYTIQPRDGGDDRVYALAMRYERGKWKPCPTGDR